MRYVESVEVLHPGGVPVGVVRFSEPMEVLSSAVLNGGSKVVRAAFVMQVSKNYDCSDPIADIESVRDALDLPEDTLGMMTAAEVDHVFNQKEVTYDGITVGAFATAGLSNHVVAGEVLDDYEEKSAVSARRAAALHAGTINVWVVSPVPLTDTGKVNLFIPIVEAKGVALAEHGFAETGTTTDSMAVFSPAGDGTDWTGTGSGIGIAAARAVTAAVGHALDVRDEHPIPMLPSKILGKLGVDVMSLRGMIDSDIADDAFSSNLDALLSDPDVASLMDMAWFLCDRLDSMSDDGDPRQSNLFLNMFSERLGVDPPEGVSVMDGILIMIANKAGGIDGRRKRIEGDGLVLHDMAAGSDGR